MPNINVVRYSDGRTVYNCKNPPYAPTNPKAGTPYSGNTLTWSSRTREVSLIVPRQQDEYIKSQTVRDKSPSPVNRYPSVAAKRIPVPLPCDAPPPGTCKKG